LQVRGGWRLASGSDGWSVHGVPTAYAAAYAKRIQALSMAGYKEPSFADRTAAATAARAKALAKLKAKPALSAEEQAARIKAAAEREAAEAARREAVRAEREAKKAAELQRKLEAAEAAKPKPKLSDAELKALRDARYAARKARKK
jgi:hypothetical protein